jgi:hypothetical protein
MKFHRTSLSDIQGSLPELVVYDLLVCVNGFEDRSVAVPALLASLGMTANKAIVLHYPSNVDDNRRTIEKLQGSLEQISAEAVSLEFGMAAPALREELRSISADSAVGGRVRVLLDVSGASGRMILRLIRFFFELASSDDLKVELTVGYAEAAEYAPTQAEARSLIEASSQPGESTLGLDFDAEELSPSVEYPGQHIEHVPDRAIVICGFNADRGRAALDHIDTAFNIDVPHSRVTYIAGQPPRESDRWRLDAMMQINSSGVAEPIDFHVTSTLHYQDTLKKLESRYQESFGHERITVLPFGSKMQTLAAALYCEMHADVKVQLLAPARYAGANYSMGQGDIHFLPLGDLSKLSALLSSVGQLVEVR